jgi:hypothetical protein
VYLAGPLWTVIAIAVFESLSLAALVIASILRKVHCGGGQIG